MRKLSYLLLFLALLPLGLFAQKKSSFEIKDGDFYLNGKATPIYSGEMHYSRIPHQYWRHRFQMMRAMGQSGPELKPILEINAEHPIVAKLKDTEDEAFIKDVAEVLFNQALLIAGVEIKEPTEFVKHLNNLLA